MNTDMENIERFWGMFYYFLGLVEEMILVVSQVPVVLSVGFCRDFRGSGCMIKVGG